MKDGTRVCWKEAPKVRGTTRGAPRLWGHGADAEMHVWVQWDNGNAGLADLLEIRKMRPARQDKP